MRSDSMYICNSNALAILIEGERICLTTGTICILHKRRGLNVAAPKRIIYQSIQVT